ncbi:DNA-directed DNA polymerase II large subunit [Halobiforma nitratireducens]|uniref:DNA polymerase II large subunit n=1 Tax=Halobiforma nitratireducens JCM 10879 TaxID=1227454 RepID=M0L8C4_9EURY|nr:DNA-directed DNA polymerase II large subunit [Halobiforma nitratireducens]EMA29333.1 DNA polymerase II large subunit [Halobiforma nitratireducens JCM 10879]
MREEDERYFQRLESQLESAFDVAEEAKERGADPEPEVEIPTARDMADRVENILGIDGVAERVRELEGEMSREEAALELAEDFAEGRVGDYETKAGKVEGAVRTAVALLTEGVVAAPIEGIDKVEILENDDGTEFVNVYYAGPIRSAGGTAQALSVLVADYTRALVGIDQYKARDDEIERYAEEIALYDKETGLQYCPKDKEAKFIAKNLPIMLDGEATGDEEVSGFRDLERVDTNSARGGMCLVLGEGIALKAPKIQRYTRNLEEVDWPWLQDLIDGNYGDGDDGAENEGADDGEEADEDDGKASDDESGAETGEGDEPAGPPRVDESKKFLRDLIAGRPVFSHPCAEGGFRLRYGRARNHGFATAGVHPAAMHLVDDFLATGTQIKTERPGKAAGVVPVDSIEGPTVKLANGDVRRIDDPEDALEIRNGVEKILDLGEYLVNYGEFVENNHPLAPASYTYEWWLQDLAAAGADIQALQDDPAIDLEFPDPEEALEWALEYDAPLHPEYTYLWHDISVDAFCDLADAVADGQVEADGDGSVNGNGDDSILVLAYDDAVAAALETIVIEHRQREDEGRIEVDDWRPFVRTVGCEPRQAVTDGAALEADADGRDEDPEARAEQPTTELERTWAVDDLSERARTWGHEEDGDNAVEAVNEVAPFEIRERAPTRIGNRMGRPEKSESRDLSPAVHTLFPIGEAGGTQRNVADAAKHAETMSDTPGIVEVQVGRQRCPDCDTETFKNRCPECNARTEPDYRCPDCDQELEPDDAGRVECDRCEIEGTCVENRDIDVNDEYRSALETVGERENAFDILKGVKGLSSTNKVPEPIEKGILRAKHDVSSFKDGTVRYDMTDLPVTSVRASELDIDVGQLQALGYEEDIHGEPLTHEDQLVELKVQDIVLSDGAAEHMMQTADFIDDLLEQYYGLEPFYELEDRQDLVGELVFGMAPHTSAATVGRVIGFTSAAVGYAHPYFHAAKRRNCFHPETTIRYVDESGTEREASIATFVESRLTDPREDDFGTLIQDLDGSITVPSIDDDGRHVTRSVEAVSKHPAPDHLIRVETRSGRSLTVTPDHTMVVWNAGLERVAASELEAGDEIPTPAGADSANGANSSARTVGITDGGRPEVDIVERAEIVPSDVEYTYCLTVSDTNTLVANGLHTAQCDGDEDCVMLLMDGLLNFSRSYLPDKRGGSVAEDSRLIAFDPDGNLRFMTFDEFWDELDVPIEIDGKFQKKTAALEGWTTYAFNDDHEAAPKPIEKAIRYEADDDEELLRISTQFGRELEITTDHSLFRYDDGIEEVAGSDLEEGDLIVAPQNLDVEPIETMIDALECVSEPYVLLDDEHEGWLTEVWNNAERGGDTRVAFDGGLSYRLSKKKVRRETLEEIEAEHGDADLPDECSVGWQGSSDCIDRYIDIDEEFAWLIGMFVAEGTLSGTRPAIHNADEDLVDRLVKTTESVLGCEPSVRWSNKAYEVAFPAVFFDVLHELGFEDCDSYDSSEKIVPDCILRAERDIVLAFLRGFIAGDGSESSDDNHTSIGFHTTSEDVKDGIVFCCHRLGLVANVSRRERDSSRQPIYTVSVSGGASRNPLEQILDGDEPYHPKSLVVSIPDELMEIREMEIKGIKQLVPKYLKRRDNISLEKLEDIVDELEERDLPDEAEPKLEAIRPLVDGDLSYLRITDIERVEYDGYLYDLQVGGDPIFTANWLYAHNSMDAPLVMSSRIDPSEIDDEAHNMDIVSQYPREFYEATLEQADPEAVDIQIGEDTLGTDGEYTGFEHTHDTTDIAMGPDLSAYKTLGSMMEKMDAQLELSRKLEAVDETDVAERVIEYHFLPDLIGNLRAFSRQETRCLDCGEKFRRMPLTGDCRECGGQVNLTVHQGSVNKYMQTAIQVAEEYDCRDYTKQRLEVLEKSLESIFENDKNKQSGIEDFM